MILGPRGSRAIRERRGAWQGKRRCGMHATNMERCGNDFHFAHLRVCRCECVFIDVGLNYGKTLLSWPHAALRAMRQQNSTLWSAVDRCIEDYLIDNITCMPALPPSTTIQMLQMLCTGACTRMLLLASMALRLIPHSHTRLLHSRYYSDQRESMYDFSHRPRSAPTTGEPPSTLSRSDSTPQPWDQRLMGLSH